MVVISLIKKNEQTKKWLKYMGLCVGVLFITVALSSNDSSNSNETTTMASESSKDTSKQNTTKNKNPKIDTYKKFVSSLTDQQSSLSETSINFINGHSNLFPTKTDADVNSAQNLIDHSIGYKHLDKNITPYLEKLINVNGTVVDTKEDTFNNEIITYVHILTDDYESFELVFSGNLKDIFKESYVTAVGLPLCTNSFSNVSGGTTKSIVLLGSTIEIAAQ
ncbi:hypothetical protein BCM0075_1332 [Bacillus cereus]|nr:hypothetical protein BCM0075_1332 [Bacillus cereus]